MRKLTALVVALALLGSMAGCGSGSTKPTQPTVPASKSVVATFLPSDCANQVERPSSFLIACADGGSVIEHLVWRSWGNPIAKSSGFAFANDCEPNCVAGGSHHAAAEMYVSRLRKCGRKLQYTYAVIIASTVSIAQRTTGAYDIACAGPGSSGVSRTEPEAEVPGE
jgi:curli biogenesis system outer membrane secretion channel CsgG